MTSRRAVGSLLFFSIVVALPLALACGRPGERIRGSCPAGETCSTLVDQLFFAGSSPTAHSFWDLAEGGTERVRVQTGIGLGDPPYARAFDARSSDASILVIGTTAPPDVTLHGAAVGHAYLRVLEPGSNLLLDRVDVRVGAVASVSVESFLSILIDPDHPQIVAVWADGALDLITSLRDAGGLVLWDDSLVVVGHPTRVIELPAGLAFAATAPTTGALDLVLTRDAASHPVSMPVVTTATSIALLGTTTALTIDLGTSTYVCAMARSATGLIAGARFAVTLPTVLVDDPTAGIEVDGRRLDGCIGVRATAVGTGALTLAAGGATATVQIDVRPASASPLTGPPLDLGRARGWARGGERGGRSAW